jgi:hypothetical protein
VILDHRSKIGRDRRFLDRQGSYLVEVEVDRLKRGQRVVDGFFHVIDLSRDRRWLGGHQFGQCRL